MDATKEAELVNLRTLKTRISETDVFDAEEADTLDDAVELIESGVDAAIDALKGKEGLKPSDNRTTAFALLSLAEEKLNDLDALLDGVDAEAEFPG
jgi:hypothetical protein